MFRTAIASSIVCRGTVWRPRRPLYHQQQKRASLVVSSAGATCCDVATPSTEDVTNLQNRHVYMSHDEIVIRPKDDQHNAEEQSALIATITLNRPNDANSIGNTMLQQLEVVVDELETRQLSSSFSTHANTTPRCLLIQSSHPKKVFSAGADLKERAAMSVNNNDDSSHQSLDVVEMFVTRLRTVFQRISALQIPSIAVVEGLALGGGFELALAADLRVVTDQAVMGLPETTLAIIPGAGGTQRLSQLVGPSAAKDLIWTGRRLTGAEAYNDYPRGTLVDYLVMEKASQQQQQRKGADQASSEMTPAKTKAIEIASTIAQKGPIAICAAKEAIDSGWSHIRTANPLEPPNMVQGKTASVDSLQNRMEQALEVERRCYRRVLQSKDRLEGLAAFLERRAPHYRGE